MYMSKARDLVNFILNLSDESFIHITEDYALVEKRSPGILIIP